MSTQEDEIAERFMDIDDKSNTITGIFVSGDRIGETQSMVEGIARTANDMHRADCHNNPHCRGLIPYGLAALKSYLIIHPELSEFDRMAIIASLMFSLGAKEAHGDEDENDGLPDDIMKMAIRAGFPSFEEFSKRMDKMREGDSPEERKSFKERIEELMKRDGK